MKRKWWFLALLVLVLVVVPTGSAFAQDDAKGRPTWMPFTLQGEIVEKPVDLTIKVRVFSGNRPVKPFIGSELTVQVGENTKYYQRTDEGLQEIPFQDLAAHQLVLISGRARGEEFIARRVVVKKPRPIPFTARGEVLAIDTTNQNFSMSVLRGSGAAKNAEDLTIYWNDDTEFSRRGPDGVTRIDPANPEEFKDGDRVQVIGTYAEGTFTAKKVLVLPPKPVPFWLKGNITELAVDKTYLKVNVVKGRGAAKDLVEPEVQIMVADNTRYLDRTSTGVKRITFDDLNEGDLVHVAGRELGGVFTAVIPRGQVGPEGPRGRPASPCFLSVGSLTASSRHSLPCPAGLTKSPG